MGILGKILAIVVMGLIGCFVIGLPVNMIVSGGNSDTSAAPGVIAALIATLVLAVTASTARSAWSRLFLTNGLACLALPLVGIAWSVMVAPTMINKATFASGGSYAAEAGAQAGAVIGGAMLTGTMAFVGFFMGAIFLVLAFFIRDRDRQRA
jgi:hypothetical protein